MPRVLVVDDNRSIREMLRAILEEAGFEVMESVNGVGVMKLCLRNTIDLVITDLIMPDKDGLELLRDLRKAIPNLKTIAISGGGEIEPEVYLNLAQRLGARRTFRKPIDPASLVQAAQELCSSRGGQQRH